MTTLIRLLAAVFGWQHQRASLAISLLAVGAPPARWWESNGRRAARLERFAKEGR